MKTHSKTTKGVLAFAFVTLMVLAVSTIALFSDRVSHQMQIRTVSFTGDGYTLERSVTSGPLIAGEDVAIFLKETNSNSVDISSTITMTTVWESPDPASSLFDNSASSDNVVITLGNEPVSYTSNGDGSATFVVPQHVVAAGAEDEAELKLHLPDSLKGTGELHVSFEKVVVGQYPSGISKEHGREDLNAEEKLDFETKVGWAASASSAQNGKSLMAYLTGTPGNYGLRFELAFGAAASAMVDFSDADIATMTNRWQAYHTEVTDLIFCEGMTSIGDGTFAMFESVEEVAFPKTITNIGASAFKSAGLADTVTIPETVKVIEQQAFANLSNVDSFVFQHDAKDTLSLPDNSKGSNYGAFGLSSALETSIITNNEEIKYGYKWHNDNRRNIPVLAAQDEWFTQSGLSVNKNTIKSIEFKDHYEPSNYDYTWDASAGKLRSVTAYLESITAGAYKLTLAGNGYGSILANKDSSAAFADFTGLTSVAGTAVLNTSNTITMEDMFRECASLKSINLNTWDVQHVQDMSGMFLACNALETLNLATWNTQNLTDVAAMFSSGSDSNTGSLKSIDLTGWTTGKVKYMNDLFSGQTILTEIKGLEGFDTSKTLNMSAMFLNCHALPKVDVSSFSTISATDMSRMFKNCKSITVLNISNFSTNGITTVSGLKGFANGCSSLVQIQLGDGFGQAGIIPEGTPRNGMFYVPSYLETVITGANDVMKIGSYNWVTENRGLERRYTWDQYTTKIGADIEKTGDAVGYEATVAYLGTGYTIDPNTLKFTLTDAIVFPRNGKRIPFLDYPYMILKGTSGIQIYTYEGNYPEDMVWEYFDGAYCVGEPDYEDDTWLHREHIQRKKATAVYTYKGELISRLSSNSEDAYLANGTSNGYWYTYLGSDDIDPSSVSYTAATDNSITVKIAEGTENVYGGTISYIYEYSTDGGDTWTEAVTTTDTSYTIALSKTADTQVRVRAKDSWGFISSTYVYGNPGS